MANGSFGGDNQMHPDNTTDATPRHDRGELQQGIQTTTSRDPEFCERSIDYTLRTSQGDNEVNKGNGSATRECRSRSFCRNFLRDGCSRGASCPHLHSEYTTFISPGYDWCVKLHQEILATSENPVDNARNSEIVKSDPTSSSKTNLVSSMDTDTSVLNKEANAEMKIDCSQEEGEKAGQVLKTSEKRKQRSKCNGTQLDICPNGGVDSISPSKTNLISSMDTDASVLNKDANAVMNIDCSQQEGEKDGQVLKTSKKRKRRSERNGTQLDICSNDAVDSTSSSKTNLISSMDADASVLNKDANAEMIIDSGQEEGGKDGQVLKTSKKRERRSERNGTKLDICSNGGVDSTSSSKTNFISSMDTDASVLNKDANAEMNIDCSQEEGEKDGQVLKTSKKRRRRSEHNGTELDISSNAGVDSTTTVLDKNAAEPHIVENVSTTNNSLQKPHSSIETVLSSKRTLLVLDVNGILADITPVVGKHKPVAMLSGKAVYKRLFCEDFIDFCFERFDVGLWSSRTRKNVDKVVNLLMGERKKRLLFCWDQSHCTTTGYKTLQDNKKPLFLKELKELWEKHRPEVPWDRGYYNETNTVLLDDSPYKALSNPPYTGIFPRPFTVWRPNDRSLGPEGDLRHYLKRLAEAKDVREFIRQNPFGQKPITDKTRRWNDFYSIIAANPKASVPKTKKRKKQPAKGQQGKNTSNTPAFLIKKTSNTPAFFVEKNSNTPAS